MRHLSARMRETAGEGDARLQQRRRDFLSYFVVIVLNLALVVTVSRFDDFIAP